MPLKTPLTSAEVRSAYLILEITFVDKSAIFISVSKLVTRLFHSFFMRRKPVLIFKTKSIWLKTTELNVPLTFWNLSNTFIFQFQSNRA